MLARLGKGVVSTGGSSDKTEDVKAMVERAKDASKEKTKTQSVPTGKERVQRTTVTPPTSGKDTGGKGGSESKDRLQKVLNSYKFHTGLLAALAIFGVLYMSWLTGDFGLFIPHIKEFFIYAMVSVVSFIVASAIYKTAFDKELPTVLTLYFILIIAVGLILTSLMMILPLFVPSLEGLASAILQPVELMGGLRFYLMLLTLFISNSIHLSTYDKFSKTAGDRLVEEVFSFTAVQAIVLILFFKFFAFSSA